MLNIKALAVTRCSLDFQLHLVAVLWVNPRKNEFHRRFRPYVTLKDSEGIVGPEELSARNLPPEGAHVTESLNFGRVSFTPSPFLGQEFVLNDVHGSAEGHNPHDGTRVAVAYQ
jgi:hypothetical protein